MIKTYAPNPILAEFILRYWSLESNEPSKEILVYPEGCPEMIIHWGEPFVSKNIFDNAGKPQSQSLLCCQKTVSNQVISIGSSAMLAVTFKPFGAAAFFDFISADYRNINIDLTDIFGDKFKSFIDKIASQSCNEHRIALIEKFLMDKLIAKRNDLQVAERAVNSIKQSSGIVDICSVASNSYVSTRQLERIFKKTVGLSPIEYSLITRINHSIDLIGSMKNFSLTDISLESGFYDQSHFIKSFKKYVGLNPKEFSKISA